MDQGEERDSTGTEAKLHVGARRRVAAGRNIRLGAWCGRAAFATLTVAILSRLTTGVDLFDESYYASFIDDWLKGGIATSRLATLHQTAALITYPLANVYFAVAGADGLILFLRACYLVGSVLASVAWLAFLSRFDAPFMAWLGACIVLAFIPFGLPAASYNTLGQQGLFVALAALGSARLGGPATTAGLSRWLIISAIGWAVAVVAYPSMILALGACVFILFIADRSWDARWRYVVFVVVAQSVAWSLVIVTLSWRLYESAIYLAAINDVGSVSRKWEFSVGLLKKFPLYAVSLAVAAGVGVLRPWIPAVAMSLLTAALVGSVFSGPVALFCRSHDVVTVLALTGIGLLWSWRAGQRPDRLLAIVWSVSMIAGLVTAVTAFNGLYNFCVGGAPAAAAALAGLSSRTLWARCAKAFACGVVVVALGVTSLTFIYPYGRLAPGTSLQRIDGGAFAGTWGLPEQVALLAMMREQVAPLVGPENTIVVFGRWCSGLVLVTPARALAFAILPMFDFMNPKGRQVTEKFYENPDNRPGIVVIFRDGVFPPFNPMKEALANSYESILLLKPKLGELEVYRRR